jgi:hypothetical protein
MLPKNARSLMKCWLLLLLTPARMLEKGTAPPILHCPSAPWKGEGSSLAAGPRTLALSAPSIRIARYRQLIHTAL